MLVPTTKTDIAKLAVQMAVGMKVTQITADQITQHSELDEDGIAVSVSSSVVGYLVALKLKPFTDNAVDTAVVRYYTWRSAKVAAQTSE